MSQTKATADLVNFQEQLLEKISVRENQKNQASTQWLGFFVDGRPYVVQLGRVKEVLNPPEKYLNFGEWVHEGVKGGLQHRDEIWTVFQGVQCFTERGHSKGEAWDFRLLLLRPNEMEGNVAIAADKIVGLIASEDLETTPMAKNKFGILAQVKNKKESTLWNAWEPLVWKNAPGIAEVSSTTNASR